MKTLTVLFVLGLTGFGFCETPARLLDGKVQFAIATVGTDPAFNQNDIDRLTRLHDAEKTDSTLVYYTPDQIELDVANSGIKFDNYTDYVNCVTDKQYLDDKILDMVPSKKKNNQTSIDALTAENAKR